MTKSEKARHDRDEPFWIDVAFDIVREEPAEEQVYDLEERKK
jgi:hypothetical protein